jgi:hypothetical protein
LELAVGLPYYAGIKTSIISVTQIPYFQCSDWRETSSQLFQGRAGGVVAGILRMFPFGKAIVKAPRRHLGRFTVNTPICVVCV